jgi:hypothetical protein
MAVITGLVKPACLPATDLAVVVAAALYILRVRLQPVLALPAE